MPPNLPEEIHKAGSIGGRHLWTDCVISRKRVTAKRFGSRRWTKNEHCDAKCNKTKPRKTQTDMSSLQRGQNRIQGRQLRQEKDQTESKNFGAGKCNYKNGGQTALTPTRKLPKVVILTIQTIKLKENDELYSHHPVRPVTKGTPPQKFFCSQCSKRTASLAQKTDGTNSIWTTGHTEQCKSKFLGYSPNKKLHVFTPELRLTDRIPPKQQQIQQF